MKKLTIILAAITICLGISINGFAQKVAPVYFNVQIDDNISQPLYGIGSDGASSGTYFHGQSSVSAQFTQYGFFSFNSGTRFVKAYYSGSQYDSLNTLPTTIDSSQGVKITTHTNSTYAQNMTVDQVLCMALSVNIPVAGYSRIIGYHAGHGVLTNTSYAKVTRLQNSNNKRVWTIESDTQGTCKNSDGTFYDNIARIRDAKTSGKPVPDIDYGRYNMPFKLILTEK